MDNHIIFSFLDVNRDQQEWWQYVENMGANFYDELGQGKKK